MTVCVLVRHSSPGWAGRVPGRIVCGRGPGLCLPVPDQMYTLGLDSYAVFAALPVKDGVAKLDAEVIRVDASAPKRERQPSTQNA